MNQQLQNNTCKAHSGLEKQIEALEANVSKLWERWDKMNTIVIGIFATLSLNLIATIIILFLK